MKATFEDMAASDNYAMQMAGQRLLARLGDTPKPKTPACKMSSKP